MLWFTVVKIESSLVFHCDHAFCLFPHLYCAGVILRASNNTCGPVEACRGLEGNCKVVRLRDVLHGR